jgi:hypothetical protein
LLAHGELPAGYRRPDRAVCRAVNDVALDLLVDQTLQGRGLLWNA